MRVVIVEDEQPALEQVRILFNEIFPQVEICAEATTVEDAHEKILLYNPELVLMDIDLPDGNAFTLLRRFARIDFRVIFTTAHERYALQAIKYSALDFLLKPYTAGEFADAIRRAQEVVKEEEENLKYKTLFSNMQDARPSKVILRTSEVIHAVEVDDIIRLEADGSYTTIYFKNSRPLIVSKNLKEYENLFKSYGFVRPHQSHLVNMKHVVCMHKADGGTLEMIDSSVVPVSVRMKNDVLEAFRL